ncbi:MAG: glycosyltransferase family 2 protein [candidate division Zixibacteria bacterium]|nr:glycosyltransferase family 2 protein [candidate division Zixibacteria bacterium]
MDNDKQIDLSLVIPLYDEENNVSLLYKKLKEVLDSTGRSYEIVYIDDGSRDNTLEELTKLHEQDDAVKVISFSTNFGKGAGLSAGFEFAQGDYIITMDGDLQDDPQDILVILEKLDQGIDLVAGWKPEGKGSAAKSIPSWMFNRFTAIVTGLKIHDMNCPFKGYKRDIAKNIGDEIHGDLFRYIPLIARRRGYSIEEVVVRNYPRQHGKSKFGMTRFVKGFLDFLTILFLTRFTMSPLHLFGTMGLIPTFFGSGIIFYLYGRKFLYGINVGTNLPLFTLSVLMVIFGVQVFSIGLLGEMIVNRNKSSDDKFKIKKVLK